MRRQLEQLIRGNPAARAHLEAIKNSSVVETPQSESDILRKKLGELLDRFPGSIREYAGAQWSINFQLSGLYRTLITGICDYHSQQYRIFVDLSSSPQSPVGCTCERSEGHKPCPHGFLFIKWLLREWQSTQIRSRIEKAAYDSNPPTIASFKPDPNEKYRQVLRQFSRELSRIPNQQIDSMGSLQVAEKAHGRIAWNFCYGRYGEIELVPFLQTPKKRCDGWTKGKRIDPFDLKEYNHLLSVPDQRVRDMIGYLGEFDDENSPVDAAMELIGQSNVLLEGEPVEVRPLDLRIELQVRNGTCDLVFSGMLETSTVLSNGVLALADHGQTLRVCRLNSDQVRCVELVNQLPEIPESLKHELIQIARSLQEHVTVELPAEFVGEQVADPAKPLLLLLLDERASLHFGCRVRLESGRVAIPGQGSLIKADTRDNKPVQLVRNHDNELRLCSELCTQLNLPQNELQGAITDFEQVMACLQKVRELEGSETKLEVLWDQKSQQPIRMLGNITPANLRVSVQKSRDWLQLSGECDFGDTKMELGTLLRSLRSLDSSSIQGNYVRLADHGWAKISDSLRKHLNKLHDSVNEDRKQLVFDASSAKVIQQLSDQQIQITGTSAWTKCLERMDRSQSISPVLPKGLNAQLREYQFDGFCWMRRLAEWGVGGILADDMGLGKTLQTLAVLLDRMSIGPALVIAPTSVGFNWIREAEKFAPELKAHLYRETDREEFLTNVGPGDLVVSSYGLILRDAEKLAKIEWGTLVLDEAQAIKNARSKTATTIAELKADWKLALTGTPVENHLGELWSLFRAIAPGIFGGWEQFRKRFAGPIEKDNDEERKLALRERIQPFILRRTKQEVLKDLPARTEMNQYVDLTAQEREVYDRVRLSAVGELDELAKLSDIQDQRFKMLALLTRLRQLACSPKLVHADWPGRSSKIQHLAETLQELRAEGHRALVFSQFVTHLELIRQMLVEEGISFQYLDGSTSAKERERRVDEFQAGSGNVFLISLKAGGTGLNLTAADYVIHTDPWWNPAVEDQATDRAHRIGQDKPVMVYRLISKGTIEEEILKLHDSKRDLVAGILEGSHSAGRLSTEDLMQLIRG